jgi:putative hydroxymethylpyrimidine transport system substrate-binding protein
MTRRLAVAALAVLAAAGLAACGTKSEPTGPSRVQRLTLMLDFFPNADHAGIYEAIADGELRRAGLDLRIETPSDPSAPLKLLQAGKVDLAISYEPELLLARDKGADLVSVAALVQRPLTSIIAIGTAHLRSPADLENHTVGTAGIPYQHAYLQTILKAHGADPARDKEVDVGFDLVRAMLTKKVYATLGGFWNYEGIQLQRRHAHPTILPVDRAGVPTYDELVIVVRRDVLRRRGDAIHRFLQALALAHQALRRDPSTGVAALLRANPDLDAGLQRAAVRATLPAFFPSDKREPWGWEDPRQWAAYADWMARNGLLTQPPAGQRALTNELLPGQGDLPGSS